MGENSSVNLIVSWTSFRYSTNFWKFLELSETIPQISSINLNQILNMITSRILDEVRKDSHPHAQMLSVLVDTGGTKETIVGRNAMGNHTERASAPEMQETF